MGIVDDDTIATSAGQAGEGPPPFGFRLRRLRWMGNGDEGPNPPAAGQAGERHALAKASRFIGKGQFAGTNQPDLVAPKLLIPVAGYQIAHAPAVALDIVLRIGRREISQGSEPLRPPLPSRPEHAD